METDTEKARSALENAIYRALEAELSPDDIQASVRYVLEQASDA